MFALVMSEDAAGCRVRWHMNFEVYDSNDRREIKAGLRFHVQLYRNNDYLDTD